MLIQRPGTFHPLVCSHGRIINRLEQSHKQGFKRQSICATADADSAAADKAPSPAILDRIQKAREYKQAGKAASQKSAEARVGAVAPREADPSSGQGSGSDEYNQRLAAYGAQLAQEQQEALVSAVADLREDASQEDQVAEISSSQQLQRVGTSRAERTSPSLHAKLKRSPATDAPQDTFSSRHASAGTEAGLLDGEKAEDLGRRQAAVSGSEANAASYLQDVVRKGQKDVADMRPEMFTLFKDEEQKARGVEFITKDGTYNPQQQEEDTKYKPKVATWGMFPRPGDISKAYGGGRTYKPGEALESSEQAQQRKERVAAAILDYRRKQGLFIDPKEEAQWNAVYSAGMQLMQSGQLEAAIGQFNRVIGAVPSRSKLGGEAQLQRAICLDSAGRNEEAYKIYLTLERHPASEVQKRAKRMIFGFRAADNLKVGTMSYRIGAKGNKDWEKYFTQLTGDWNSGYIDSGENQTSSTAVAAAVLLLPLLVIAVIVVPKL